MRIDVRKTIIGVLSFIAVLCLLAACAPVEPQTPDAGIDTPVHPTEEMSMADAMSAQADAFEQSDVPAGGAPSSTDAQTLAADEEGASEKTPDPSGTNRPASTTKPTEAPTAETTPQPTTAPTAEPTPEPTPEPTEEPTPEPTPEPTEEPQIVRISIDCRNATEAGVPGAPSGGWIMGTKEVEWQPGDTAWDITNRICQQRGVSINKRGSGSSIFIVSFSGVAPVDATSGWMYFVNGSYVFVGCGGKTVSPGDTIRWKYTMNGGGDV